VTVVFAFPLLLQASEPIIVVFSGERILLNHGWALQLRLHCLELLEGYLPLR
jgi:hypothetical protein